MIARQSKSFRWFESHLLLTDKYAPADLSSAELEALLGGPLDPPGHPAAKALYCAYVTRQINPAGYVPDCYLLQSIPDDLAALREETATMLSEHTLPELQRMLDD